MAYGQTDEIIEEREARDEAVQLLLAIATRKKTIADVRLWLERNYPLLCQEKTETKKW